MAKDECRKLLRKATAHIDKKNAELIRSKLTGSRLTQTDLENALVTFGASEGETTLNGELNYFFLASQRRLYKKGKKLLSVTKEHRREWTKRVVRTHLHKRILAQFAFNTSEEGAKKFINFCVFTISLQSTGYINIYKVSEIFTKDKLFRKQISYAAERTLSSDISLDVKKWLVMFIERASILGYSIFENSLTLKDFCYEHFCKTAVDSKGRRFSIWQDFFTSHDLMNMINSRQLDDYAVAFSADDLSNGRNANYETFNDSRMIGVLHRMGSVPDAHLELFWMISRAMDIDNKSLANGGRPNILEKWIDHGLVEIVARVGSTCADIHPEVVEAIAENPLCQKFVMASSSRGSKIDDFSLFEELARAAKEKTKIPKLQHRSMLYRIVDDEDLF